MIHISVDVNIRLGQCVKAMAPVARKPLPEEKVLGGIAKCWAYLAYTIKQLIILFPNLWAGYEMARRKEEKRKCKGQQRDQNSVGKGRKDFKSFVQSLNYELDKGGEISSVEEELVVGYLEGLTWGNLTQEANATSSNDVEKD